MRRRRYVSVHTGATRSSHNAIVAPCRHLRKVEILLLSAMSSGSMVCTPWYMAQEIPRNARASWGLVVVERRENAAKGYAEVQAPKRGHDHLFTRTLLSLHAFELLVFAINRNDRCSPPRCFLRGIAGSRRSLGRTYLRRQL